MLTSKCWFNKTSDIVGSYINYVTHFRLRSLQQLFPTLLVWPRFWSGSVCTDIFLISIRFSFYQLYLEQQEPTNIFFYNLYKSTLCAPPPPYEKKNWTWVILCTYLKYTKIFKSCLIVCIWSHNIFGRHLELAEGWSIVADWESVA